MVIAMGNNTETWYIVKQQDGSCKIISMVNQSPPSEVTSWGPFNSQADAIAKRVGLIRAGKCQPK
jgi:hypothetical protein